MFREPIQRGKAGCEMKLLCGDCHEILPTLPAESVHCCVTSPPYWGLRDYGTAQWEGGSAECDHNQAVRNHNGEKQGTSKGSSRESFAGLSSCRKCGARRIDQQLGLEPTPEEYVSRMVEVFREVRRVLRADGTCWINLGDSYAAGGQNSGSRIEDLTDKQRSNAGCRSSWHSLARGLRATGGRLVSAIRHHLAQAQPDAGIGD
jgi:DNA modification methylase